MFLTVLSVIGWILLGLLCLFIIGLLLPVSVWINYDKEGLTAKVGVFFIKYQIFPFKAAKAKKKKEPKKPKKQKEKPEKPKPEKEQKPVDKVLLVKRIASAAGAGSKLIFRFMRFRKVRLYIPVHHEDPYHNAMDYWMVQGAVGSTRAVLENLLNIRFEQLEVMPDFGHQSTKGACFSCKITATVVIMVVAGVLGFRQYLRYRPVAYTQKEYLDANPQHLPKLRRQMKKQRQKEKQKAQAQAQNADA